MVSRQIKNWLPGGKKKTARRNVPQFPAGKTARQPEPDYFFKVWV
jgi:hypothetical protein